MPKLVTPFWSLELFKIYSPTILYQPSRHFSVRQSRAVLDHSRTNASHPAIGPYIPLDPKTVFKKYVVPIDVSAQDQLISLMMKQCGLLTVAFDGVTVNSKSKILFTVTCGTVSAFVTWIDLGSEVHVTSAEANAAFHVMKELKKEFKGLRITCIAVDNAAAGIAAKVVAMLRGEGDRPFTLRDPVHCHCIDLGSKDLTKCLLIKAVLDVALAVNKFVMGNRIANIKSEMLKERTLNKSHAGKLLPETRMNLTNQVIEAAIAQKNFINALPDDERFQTYRSMRTASARNEMDSLFSVSYNLDRINFYIYISPLSYV